MAEATDDFYSRLARGPAFLLLGQDYLRVESGQDSFLSEITRKYGHRATESTQHAGYDEVIGTEMQRATEPALAWMQHLCDRLPTPHWLNAVARFPWSAVYSSAIDAIWPRAFRMEWRDLQPLYEEKFRPLDPRNRRRLHCTFLFGCVDRTEDGQRPPLTELELLKRRQVAVSLVARLPELITPLGTLLIEGYCFDRDWLSPKDLLPVVDNLNSGQAHIFSANLELLHNPLVKQIADAGKLVLHQETLAVCLSHGETSGLVHLGRPLAEEEQSRRIQLEDRTLDVPLALWNQVSRSAIILEDAALAPGPPLSKEKLYTEFRSFLSESGIRPVWPGYERGFAFAREFENGLYAEVERNLKAGGLQKEPVILHGQTGTGKTVALGALVCRVRKEKKYPVLFVERKPQKPLSSDLDAFCKWAEDLGAAASLIVWDGMVEVDQYYGLLRYLVGRGRKAVIVGSSYRITSPQLKQRNFIEAPASLTAHEISGLKEFLKRFDPALSELIQRRLGVDDDSFLVALYRLLPPTRGLIRTGLMKEVGYSESELAQAVQKMADAPPQTSLGYALWKANLLGAPSIYPPEPNAPQDDAGQIQKLIGLVMVPGVFGLRVPLDLLLRAWGKQGHATLVRLLNQVDLFRWSEDPVGNFFVGPRHPLEAKLIANARLAGAKAEVAFAKELLIEVRQNDSAFDNPEIEFAVDLVQGLGPNSVQDAGYYSACFRELSECLCRLREERGVENPRLMLQEAALLRDSVRRQSQYGEPAPDTIEMLDKSENILRRALRLLENAPKAKQLRGFIVVELASTLGSKTRHILDYSPDKDRAVQLFEETRAEAFQAMSLDPDNFYPIDVMAWVTRDVITANVLSDEKLAEAEVDILYTFETAKSGDFGPLQLERFHSRRLQLANILKKSELSEEAFQALARIGSGAGYYLRAQDIIGDLDPNSELSPTERRRCSSAADYLEEHRRGIARDGRCMNLLLRLWWVSKTGKPIFYGERQTVPFRPDDWQYCCGVINDLLATGEMYTTVSTKFLYGLATFHMGMIDLAMDIFRELERESDYVHGRRRIVRSYLASTPKGEAAIYHGTVDWASDDGRKGELYVSGLRRRISFIPRDFGRPDIQKDEAVGPFHLAFNFRGVIADPPRYLKEQ